MKKLIILFFINSIFSQQQILDIDYKYDQVGEFSPFITEKNIDLSLAFFKQMDELGEKAYKDLIELVGN